MLSGFAAPAAAHDKLLNSTPGADEVLTSAPTEVSLTFSAPLNPDATQLAVVDSETRSVVNGSPRIDGATVRQALKPGLPDGEYRVSYRVRSSDEHWVDGTRSFTVRAAASPSESATPPKPPAGTQDESPEAESRESSDSDGISPWWIGAGAVVIVLCVAAGSVLVWRRRSGIQTRE